MKLLILPLMLSWVNSNLLTEENLFTSEIDLYDDGSGIEINEHSGDIILDESLDTHDTYSELQGKGRIDFGSLLPQPEKFIGPQYHITRPNKDDSKENIDEALEVNNIIHFITGNEEVLVQRTNENYQGDINCECDCLEQYAYSLPETKNTEVNIKLQE